MILFISEGLIKKCTYYFELEEVMGSRPNITPPFPNSTEEPINARELFFPTAPPFVAEEISESDSDEEEVQQEVQREVPAPPVRRPLSAASKEEKPAKKARKALEDTLAAALAKQEEANAKQLELEERRFEAQERRADEAREEREEKKKMDRMQMTIAMAQLWKSLGMSPEEIQQRLDTLWE